MTAADKPRADLVALFDAFAASAPAYSSLQLHGDVAAESLLDWGHGARAERRERADGSAALVACLDLPNRSWIVAHFDRESAPADQQVLARVQAALDGEQPDDWQSKERPLAFKSESPSDFACTTCGETMQSYDQFDEYQHENCGGLVKRKEQPEAAEGSV